MYELFVADLFTPYGMPLEVEVFYDASIDSGNLAVTSAGEGVLWLAPFTSLSHVSLKLVSDEELSLSARRAAEPDTGADRPRG